MSTQSSDNNKRIAKNAIFLYIRMFLSMAVSLYTSRIILLTLGVMDYGIWNVVAGVISMFIFINVSMAGCSNRFLSFELGKGDYDKLQRVFSVSLTVHILIALVIFVLGETAGLWFLREKLVIPEERMFAANCIYQFSIFSCMISVTQVPYNAMIMANEKMSVYAYLEILNTLLRLIIVYMLCISPWDKLITYGVLTLIVSLGIAMSYRIYCVRKLQACSFILSLDKAILMPMLSFSGWDLYGNAAVVARTQGVNMLLNMFFTAALNAASAIATNVQGAVMAFASNVLTAFRPQIVKHYAIGECEAMVNLIKRTSIYTTYLLLLFTLPLILEIEYVLELWLKKPPAYASVFCIYVLLFNIIANLASVLVSGIHATGHIKRSSFVNGTFYLLVIPFSYFAYKNGMDPQVAFLFNVIAVCAGMIQNMFVLNKYVHEFKIVEFTKSILRFVLVSILTYVFVGLLKEILQPSFLRLSLTVICCSILMTTTTFFYLFDLKERKFITDKVKLLITKYFKV